MIYSKTLQSDTFDGPGVQHVLYTKRTLEGVPFRFDHPARAWEYGLVLEALLANEAKTVLEIGGGGSLFAPTAAMLGISVLQIDLKDCTHWTDAQQCELNIHLPYVRQDFFKFTTDELFDAVISISVIEHVSADASSAVFTTDLDVAIRALFFEKMMDLVKPGGLLAITTDYHPEKKNNIKFGEAELLALYEMAECRDFDWYGDEYDYTYAGEFVNYYTFASMILRRKDGN